MRNNKGFTFVEVLAAVTILGIISVIAITGVSRILEKSHQEYYKSQEKNLVLAAQSYMNNNKSKLPKLIGKKSKITAKELKEANYLKKEITEYDGKTVCNEDNTYVNVFKYGQTDYSYTAVVSCTNYLSKEAKTSEATPNISVDFNPEKKDLDVVKNDLKHAKVVIDFYGDNIGSAKLLSYNYALFVVTKSGSNIKYVELYNTGNREAERVTNLSKTIDLSKYTITGKPIGLQVRATATNINGISKTVHESFGYEDTIKPTCVIKDEDKENTQSGVKDWVNNQRTISVGCKDSNGSGCDKPSYTKTFTKENIADYITIYDDAGNSNRCNVTTYIDRTKPSLTIKAYKCKKDSNNNLVADTDHKVGEKTINGDASWTSSDLSDNHNGWLNKANYPNGVCFVIEARDNLALGSTKWSWNKTGHAKDASGYKTLNGNNSPSSNLDINKNNYKTVDIVNTKTYKPSLSGEGHRYAEFYVEDGFGNNITLKLDIKIDRTAPSVPTINMKKWKDNNTRPTSESGLTGYSHNAWSTLKVFTYPSGSTDAISGGVYYQYTTTGKTTNNANKTATYRNVEAQGVSFVEWRSVDEAGNPSDYADKKTIKIDYTAPTVTVNAYKCNASKAATGNATGTITVNNSGKTGTLNSSSLTDQHNGWLNNSKYNHGVCFTIAASDNVALATKNWAWNTSGKTKNANGYDTLNGGSSPETYNVTVTSGFTTSKSYSCSLTAEGHRYGRFTFTDGSGNTSYINVNMLIDRTAPTVSLSSSNDKYTLSGTASDSISKIKSYRWGGSGNYTTITVDSSTSQSINHGTSDGSNYSFYAKDEAGNSNSDSTATYKWCTKKSNSGGQYCGSYGSCQSNCKKYAGLYQNKVDAKNNSVSCGTATIDASGCSDGCTGGACPPPPPPPSSDNGGGSSGGGGNSGGGNTGGGNSGGGGGTCFLAGTKINTQYGPVAIEKLLVGTKILSYNEETQQNEYHSIKHLLVLKAENEKLYTLTFDDGTKLSLTSKHRVYVNSINDYVKAEELKIGDTVLYSDNTKHVITNITSKKLNGTVYNIEVDKTHNFYVGEQQVLVHNIIKRLTNAVWSK